MMPRERLTPKEIQVAILVWQGLTNREIGKIMGSSEVAGAIIPHTGFTNFYNASRVGM